MVRFKNKPTHYKGRSADSLQISGVSYRPSGIEHGELDGLFVPLKQ